jgi:hypothetical protein
MHSSFPHSCYMPCHDHSTYVWQRVKVVKFLIFQFSQIPWYIICLWSKCSPEHLMFKHSQPVFSRNIRDQISRPYRTMGRTIISYILIFMLLSSRQETKDSELNGSKHCPNSVCPKFPPESNFYLNYKIKPSLATTTDFISCCEWGFYLVVW